MNDQSGKFDFCPICGAVTKDGVCQSCGHHLQENDAAGMVRNVGTAEHMQQENSQPEYIQQEVTQSVEEQTAADILPTMEQGQNTDRLSSMEQEQNTDRLSSMEQGQNTNRLSSMEQGQNTDRLSSMEQGEYTDKSSSAEQKQNTDIPSTMAMEEKDAQIFRQGIYSNRIDHNPGDPQQTCGQYREQSGQQNGQQNGQMNGQQREQSAADYRNAYEQQYVQTGNPYQNTQGYQGNPYQNTQGYQGNPYQNTQGYQGNPYQNTQGYQGNTYQNSQGYQGSPYQNYQGNQYIPALNGQPSQNQKQNTGLIVALAIVGTILALTVAAILIFGFLVVRTAANSTTVVAETHPEEQQAPFGDEERGTEEPFQPSQSTGEDPFLEEDYVNSWGMNHENHYGDDFSGDYYENICEYIDESVDYEINREYYEYYSAAGNVAIRVGYYQLQGDIPHLEELNNDILMYSAYIAGNYFDSYGEQDYEGVMELNIDSFVTYNDDKKMSIVLDEQWNIDGGAGFDLYGINVDLQNGTLMKNDEILDIEESFAKVFRERNRLQNEYDGEIAVIADSTDEELAEYLNSSTQSIIFYTPAGMEVGFNYSYDGYAGWVTVTFKDYENYLRSF